ncbi:hypothetical protein [Raoultibacter phocaeensis]|uniref:hypothetical protein n=1 Tax=Raoultibacter phocaeensis TaxID=2479841 RepID=UPI001C5A45D4|nr:hypothetical protein [Raoultibacter phocaeensis]
MSFPRVIVSLTSYPARFEAVAQTLEPLFKQTVAPDGIELWLAEDEVSRFDGLPACLEESVQAGLSIKWLPRSLKPHTKYYGALREHPDDIVITVDDDIVYPLDLVQKLLEMHYRFPEAVIANRTHIVTRNAEGAVAPYRDWVFEQSALCGTPRRDLLATGVGGVLYPPHVFDEATFDEAVIRETSLMADDLWLMVNELRLGVFVVSTGCNENLTYVPGTQDGGLYIDNLNGGRNNDILKVLFERYPSEERTLVQAIEEREAQSRASEPADEPGCVRRLYRRIVGR